STMSGLTGRGRPAASGADVAAGKKIPDPANAESAPPANWPPKAPPEKSPKPKPKSNPLDTLARGITAVSMGAESGYVIRDKHTNTFFNDRGVTLCSIDVSKPNAPVAETRGYAVRWNLSGADAVKPRAEGERVEKVNRFVGDRSNWTSDQASYASVVYDGLQFGIDVQVETRPNNAIKYTVTAAPGADLSAFRFRYEGAHS